MSPLALPSPHAAHMRRLNTYLERVKELEDAAVEGGPRWEDAMRRHWMSLELIGEVFETETERNTA